MPSVILDRFGGEIPRISNPRKLPKTGSQRAQNVDLTSGDLVPIAVDPPFQTLHNTDGTMKPGLTSGEVTSILKPPAVTEDSKIYMCEPGLFAGAVAPWLRIELSVWATSIDEDNVFTVESLFSDGTNATIEHTRDGFIAKTRLTGNILLDTKGGRGYTIHGPIFKFIFYQDLYYRGGPSDAYSYPATSAWTDPAVPRFSVPLEFPLTMANYNAGSNGRGLVDGEETFTYGFAELTDYNVPGFEPKIITDVDVAGFKVFAGSADIDFTFRNNYVRNSEQFSFYKQTYVDQAVSSGNSTGALTGATTTVSLKDPLDYGLGEIPNTGRLHLVNAAGESETINYTGYTFTTTHDFTVSVTLTYTYAEDDYIEAIDLDLLGGREGPDSDVSALVKTDPGEIISLSMTQTTRYDKVNLYRSASSGSGFALLHEDALSNVDFGWDLFNKSTSTDLPLYGNYPQATLDEALAGSILHPANWGSIIDGRDLRLSDVNRPHVYPEGYAYSFATNIIAQALSGNSILVFTEASTTEVGKVYELVGNNPAAVSVYEISNAHPLLNKVGLAKIGQTVLWPTYDGLAATAGGSVIVETEAFFTREEWGDELPSFMEAYTSENTVWLTNPNALNWRIDLDELRKDTDPNITLSTYTAFSGSPFLWESKTFQYPRPISYNCLRVIADEYPVAVEFYNGKGEQRHAELVMNAQVKKIARMRQERDWYIRVHGTNTVYSVGFSTNPMELAADGG